MRTIEQLRALYDFNDWANRRLLVHLKSNPSEKARKLLAHILITEKEYYERLYGKDSTGFDFWQDSSLENCSDLARETSENFERLLKNFDEEGLGQTAQYKTSEGAACENDFREMLTHVLLHSAAHRGQINQTLREEGFEPVPVDYIIYLREFKKN